MHVYNRHRDDPHYCKQPCAKCGTKSRKSQHHIYPRCFVFKHVIQDLCIWLCRGCHDELELIIHNHEVQFGKDVGLERKKLPDWAYPHLALKFLTTNNGGRYGETLCNIQATGTD